MQITVEAPNGDTCNGCDVLNFNYVDMVNSVQNIHVSCRKLHVTWVSQTREVKKHHDCPTNKIERVEYDKSKSLHRAIPTGTTKEDTTIKQTKVLW